MFKNLKLTLKLLIMLLPLFAGIIIQMLYNNNQQQSIYNESKQIFYDRLYQASSLLLNADRDFYQANTAEVSFYQNTDNTPEEAESLIADYKDNMKQVEDRFSQAIDIIKVDNEFYSNYSLEDLYIMTGESASHEDLVGLDTKDMTVKQVETAFWNDLNIWKNKYNPETGEGDYEDKRLTFESVRDHLNSVTDLLSKYSEYENIRLLEQMEENIRNTTIVIAIIFVFAILLSVTIALYLKKHISNVTKDMEKLSNNDLSFTPHKLNAKDELGTLSKAVNTMYESLKEIMLNLKDSSDELVVSAETMNTSTREVDDALSDIRNAVSDIAQTSSNQAYDTQQATKEMHDLKGIMADSMQTTITLTQASEHIEQATNIGMVSLDSLVDITNNNNIAFDEIFRVLEGITNSTEKIEEASRLIAAIAEQTNLLSLNASIEAARAGEAGAGFAIVASEIRQLAEQSANSAGIIDNMISELQSNTSQANKQSDIVKEGVKSQSDSVNSTRDKYIEIVGNIKTVDQQITALEQINQQLETSFSSLNDLMQNLSAVSEETAATTEELSATADSITNNMDSIKGTSDTVDQCSKGLWEVINSFKLDEA